MLASGGVEVVDCTGVLGPDTPLLKLPPDFAKDTPKIEIHKISEYDKDGPFWAWNWLKVGEHSGTHFDAPHHWITGKDYADGYTDTLPVQRLVAPVNVLDFSAECAANPDFLLTIDHVKAWEAEHGAIKRRRMGGVAHRLGQARHDEAEFLNADETGPHTPGPTAEVIELPDRQGHRRLGQPVHRHRCRAGRRHGPRRSRRITCCTRTTATVWPVLANLDKLPAKGAILIAAPLKIENGTGSPIRALALVPQRLDAMAAPVDHVIIGSGINALVAAAHAGAEGRRVLVLERADRPGGCMRTDEVTLARLPP